MEEPTSEGSTNSEETLQEKLDTINTERETRLANIENMSGGRSFSPEDPNFTTDQPVENTPLDIAGYAVNDYTNPQDEVDELLNEVFKDAIYHPEASPENTFPFAQVMLKVRAINLKNSLSAISNKDKKMTAGLEKVMGMLKGIWDTFQLDNNQTRQHLIDAVNGRIGELHEDPEVMKHKLMITQKAMQDLEQKYNVPNAKRNTFGGGFL